MPRLLPAILCFRPKRSMINYPAAPWTVTPHCRFRLERKPWFTIRATWDLRPDATTSDILGRLRDHVLRSKEITVFVSKLDVVPLSKIGTASITFLTRV
jgi:hypothetical protein